MGIKIKILSLVIGLIFFIFILRFVKKNRFRPTYATMWIGISIFLISIPIFESFYRWIAVTVIGITDTRHIIYIALIGFLLVFSFYLTTKISQMSDRIQKLISFLAILENEIERERKR